MEILSTISGIAAPENPNQGLNDLKAAGFDKIYLDMDLICPSVEMERAGKNDFKSTFSTRAVEDPTRLEECADPIVEKAKDKGLSVSLAKAPSLSWNTRRKDLNERVKTLTREAIRICGRHEIPRLIVPPLFAGIEAGDLVRENQKFYLKLAPLAREFRVMILLENRCREVAGHCVRGLFSDGTQTADFLSDLNREVEEEVFGLAFNVGNANLCSLNMNEYLTTLGKSVKAILISDNNGVDPAALLPFTSTGEKGPSTDWLNLVRGVRATDFDGDVVLEYAHTALTASPFLKPSLLSLAKKNGEYFIWQFEMERVVRNAGQRVLFGAGNMCRNYMKNYGAEYPPLYTCDNNAANWGKTFEGLEIKNPEELKELPEDVSVFICNVYYREIEAQLREMGLNNPIVYFNDEYMPSFHFERLEMATLSK